MQNTRKKQGASAREPPSGHIQRVRRGYDCPRCRMLAKENERLWGEVDHLLKMVEGHIERTKI